jgi:uncharacterized membrane protein
MTPSLAVRCFLLGAATGMRTMAGPSAVARGRLGRFLPVFAVGEMIVDKLPQTPARTVPPAMAARVVGAALAGRWLAHTQDANGIAGALLAAAGAVTTTFAGPRYRQALAQFAPPWLGALLEDGLAIGLARAATRGTVA